LCSQSLKSVNNYVLNANSYFFVSLTSASGAPVNKTLLLKVIRICIQIIVILSTVVLVRITVNNLDSIQLTINPTINYNNIIKKQNKFQIK